MARQSTFALICDGLCDEFTVFNLFQFHCERLEINWYHRFDLFNYILYPKNGFVFSPLKVRGEITPFTYAANICALFSLYCLRCFFFWQTKLLAIEIYKWIRDAVKSQLSNIKPVQVRECSFVFGGKLSLDVGIQTTNLGVRERLSFYWKNLNGRHGH